MKTLGKLFKGLKSEISPEEIEKYYGHGAHDHVSEGHSHNNSHEDYPADKYKCPMNCEGDKTYDSPGNCPVCNMKLVPTGNQKQ